MILKAKVEQEWPVICGPSHLRSWQGDLSTNGMYGSTRRDTLHAEIVQNLLTKHDYKLATICQWNMKLAYTISSYHAYEKSKEIHF